MGFYKEKSVFCVSLAEYLIVLFALLQNDSSPVMVETKLKRIRQKASRCELF